MSTSSRETVPGAVPFGQVSPGFRADLVLVEHDPLQDLATLREPLGVMSHGVWYVLDGIARDYGGTVARPAPGSG